MALRSIHTRDFAPGSCSRGMLHEQSSCVCTNDFMGILHPREQNFHPAKCSTIFKQLNIWEQAPGANNAPLCVLTRAKWDWSMLREQNPSCVSAFRQAITCMTVYHKHRIIVSGWFALQELEEHTWSMLHNTNLNRKQGRYEKDLCTVALNVQL